MHNGGQIMGRPKSHNTQVNISIPTDIYAHSHSQLAK